MLQPRLTYCFYIFAVLAIKIYVLVHRLLVMLPFALESMLPMSAMPLIVFHYMVNKLIKVTSLEVSISQSTATCVLLRPLFLIETKQAVASFYLPFVKLHVVAFVPDLVVIQICFRYGISVHWRYSDRN